MFDLDPKIRSLVCALNETEDIQRQISQIGESAKNAAATTASVIVQCVYIAG
jgi:hypothetical protein